MRAGPVLGGVAVSFLDCRTLYWLVALGFVLLFLLARNVLSGYAQARARHLAHHGLAVLEQIKKVFRHPEIIDTSVIALVSSGASSFYNAFIIVISIEEFHYSKQAGVALLMGQGMVAVANVVRQAVVSRELGRGNVAGAGNPPAALGAVAGALAGGALGGWIGLQNVFFVMVSTYALLAWLGWRWRGKPGRKSRPRWPKRLGLWSGLTNSSSSRLTLLSNESKRF